MPQATSTARELWKDRVINQDQSGLSIADWCRQNNITPHTFYYWRDKFFPKKAVNRTDFSEIPEQKTLNDQSQSGICLQYQEFHIHLDLQFDIETFKRCIKALKGS